MNENLNLFEILKGHEGETFYCSLIGKNVQLHKVTNKIIAIKNIDELISLHSNGGYRKDGEMQLFPSKNQRDWNKWIEEQKNKTPKTWSEYLTQFGIDSEPTMWFDADMNWDKIGKSCSALFKIYQLIEVGYGGNVCDKDELNFYTIKWSYKSNRFVIRNFVPFLGDYGAPLCFHTKEQAEEFLSYPENVQLLKDYFMV